MARSGSGQCPLRLRGDPRDPEELTDADILREVMNTVGHPGRLGADIRCVVSVSMLTEGWCARLTRSFCASRWWAVACAADPTKSIPRPRISQLSTPTFSACRSRSLNKTRLRPRNPVARYARAGHKSVSPKVIVLFFPRKPLQPVLEAGNGEESKSSEISFIGC
jgi:hypothetical protein